MKIEAAVRRVVELFPFDGYMQPDEVFKHGPYSSIADAVLHYIKPGSAILDFGCGPCDKTAVLQFLGFHCSACDDLNDNWHKEPGSSKKILAFAGQCGIDFRQVEGSSLPFSKHKFDMVVLNDVLEHLHDSPRGLLNSLLELLKPNGVLLVTVPNAVNIRKRLDVLLGKTNLPPYNDYYWSPGPWRGHVREYVEKDLALLAEYLDLEVLELRGCDHMLRKLPSSIRPAYIFATSFFTGFKDSWLLVARKKKGWAIK